MSKDRDVDVLVVGSGAAGLAAALSARQNGVGGVLVAEAEGVVGGSSRLSGGLMMGAGTRYQRMLGIADDADALFHDYMTLNHWDVEAAVARRLADLAGPTVEWLGDLGVEFYDQMVYGGDERVPRVHVPVGRGDQVDVVHRRERVPGGRPRSRRAGRRADPRARSRAPAAARELRPHLRGVPAGLDRHRQPRGAAVLQRDRAVRHHRRANAGPR